MEKYLTVLKNQKILKFTIMLILTAMKKLLNNIGSIWHLRTIFVMIISQVILYQINTFCHQLTQDKQWSEMKMTKLWVGHFTTISGHFFTNYINSSNKAEVLTVILVCPIYKNLNWIQIYAINYNFCFVSVFSIL